MHLVVVQYKTFLQEAQVPKFQTGAHIFANSCNKERGGEWQFVVLVNFIVLKWNILFLKGDVKVALHRHDKETTSQN